MSSDARVNCFPFNFNGGYTLRRTHSSSHRCDKVFFGGFESNFQNKFKVIQEVACSGRASSLFFGLHAYRRLCMVLLFVLLGMVCFIVCVCFVLICCGDGMLRIYGASKAHTNPKTRKIQKPVEFLEADYAHHSLLCWLMAFLLTILFGRNISSKTVCFSHVDVDT